MGLLDILNGMQHGPRGEPQPSSSGTSGGMSPLTMAMMGLLAYKAMKSFSGAKPAAAQAAPETSAGAGGGLAGIVGAMLGRGAPAADSAASLTDMIPGGGAAAGSVVMAGLGNLIRDLQDSGHAGAVQSWVGTGPNQGIAPHDLEKALGGEALDALTKQTGIGRSDLLASLSRHLPQLIDQLTPNGRLPTQEEASRLV